MSPAKSHGDHTSDALSLARFYQGIFGQVRRDFPEIYQEHAELLLDPENLQEVIRSLDFSLLTLRATPLETPSRYLLVPNQGHAVVSSSLLAMQRIC